MARKKATGRKSTTRKNPIAKATTKRIGRPARSDDYKAGYKAGQMAAFRKLEKGNQSA